MDVAYDYEVKEVWEMALNHFLELVRLDPEYHCEVGYYVPLALLYLNRDDDAYAFVRYVINVENLDSNEILSRHARSREGDWVYPVEMNCRYSDIFKEYPDMDWDGVEDPYLLALIIIKLRIVAYHDDTARGLSVAFDATYAKRIQEAEPIVREMLLCNDIASQRRQLDMLLDNFDPRSLSALYGFRLYERERSSAWKKASNLHPFPIDVMLFYGARVLFRVPGAVDVLRSCIQSQS
ncbi:hypothetical protein FisN_14Hu385 [Fistulifera solaris]|uniref:Uncharacterized protein n=1 Tax=Fistulifera solaris TaxID=1519565 RepID=A0A1Z5K4L6_FISSO|nr:hypothetical protein FisN_14Hu385 [Fistulifera solaris]|eukprot:GAX21174.1 hypothetical protein FisN_14Hu385 [Fistulifera solaris]